PGERYEGRPPNEGGLPSRKRLGRYQNGDPVDSDFLAYIRGLVRFAFAAGGVLTLLDGKFLVCLLHRELTSGDETDHVVVHGGFCIGSPRLVYDIDDLNAFDASHIRVPGAYFDDANARVNFLAVIWAICRDDLCGSRG